MAEPHLSVDERGELSTRTTRPLRLVGLVVVFALSIVYVVSNVAVTKDFWFWWDEITVTVAQSTPWRGIQLGHFGNWFPLGRAVFAVETKIFGSTYGWYVAINSLVVIAIAIITFDQLRRVCIANRGRADWRVAIPAGLMVLYVISCGNLYNAQWGYQIAWFLSVLTVVAGTMFITYIGLSRWWYLVVLVIAFLFFSSHIVTIGLTGLALLHLQAGTVRPPSARGRAPINHRHPSIRWDVIAIVGSVILLGVGFVAARTFLPAEITARGTDIPWNYVSNQPGRLLRLLVSAITNWLVIPLWSTIAVNEGRSVQLGTWFGAHFGICLILLAVIVATIIFLTWKARAATPIRLPVGLLLLAVAVFQTMVTVRGFGGLESSLARRYDTSLLLTISILWCVVAMTPMRTRLAAGVQAIVIATIAVTLARGVWSFPDAVRSASFQPRISEAKAVRSALAECTPDAEFPPFASIQPPVRGQVCNLWLRFAD